ncbi:FAD-dependent oxidoreductase [Priestia aryabhattai]|uniref:FAD-dependent oxidoreductase n=1 Tax=Priestia aryabhattai TaxID=412384 RepID=UPI001C8E00C4|nr:FAD-dependent oxidoreductase [Priestia aryabhattai]MBY0213856.1 FAD-dependent oxidoreductase [Priestia aryabhattai]
MKPIKIPLNTTSCCSPEIKFEPITTQVEESKHKHLPVAIIGGGPIGLAAAAHLAKQGQSFILLEAGSQVGANILTWEHVRLFSPWRYNIDKAAHALLEQNGWESPELETLPTGKELVKSYLEPLANIPEIKPHVHVNTKVLSITRDETDKMKTAGRENKPFLIYAEKDGELRTYEARAILDASGTWGNPNPANSSGVWLKGEQSLQDHIFYGIPNVLETDRSRYANKRVAVVGSGHSAINTLLELAQLQETHPQTDIIWIMRKQKVEEAYGGEEKDALAARGALGSRIHHLVDTGKVKVVTPYKIHYVKESNNYIDIIGKHKGKEELLSGVDEMIVNAGNRPDVTIISELRTAIDSITESVEKLSPLIDPNLHSCGTVRAHGEEELRQPEKNFYIVGAKSYGRAPTFLMATGYEQVRSITAHLAGDYEAAKRVELDLPETGVCSVNLQQENSCSTDSNSSNCGC